MVWFKHKELSVESAGLPKDDEGFYIDKGAPVNVEPTVFAPFPKGLRLPIFNPTPMGHDVYMGTALVNNTGIMNFSSAKEV